MAYQKQSDRILAGGLRLLPPADKIQQGSAAQLENFRSDQAGQLVSRRGMTNESDPITGKTIHSLFRIGNDRYAGAGDQFRKGTRIETVLDSGFDGNPLGIAASQDNIWVMNQSKQRRYNGATMANWGIAAPTTAPVATAGSTTAVTLREFDQSEGWDVYYIGNTSYDTTKNASVEVFVTSDGTLAATNGSAAIVGTGTNWTTDMVGWNIQIAGAGGNTNTTIASVTDATHATLAANWADTTDTGLAYTITRIQSVRNWDASNKQSGTHSLHVAANPPGRYQVRKDSFGPVDLTISAGGSDADIFQMWFYASKPELITSIYIELHTGTGGPAAIVQIDPALLGTSSYSWTQLEVRRSLDTWSILGSNSDYTGLLDQVKAAEDVGDSTQATTLRAAAQQLADQLLKNTPYFKTENGFDWGSVSQMVVDVTVSEACDFHLDKANMIGGGGSTLEGDITYFVTFANNEGHESNPSPASSAVTLKRQSATVTLPVSTDPQVTRRILYRTGGGLDTPAYQVLTVFDNTSTSVADSITNDECLRNNNRLDLSNGTPPPARGLLGPYLGRLLAWNSAANPNRYWWTPTGTPERWVDANDDFTGDWEDLGEAYEPIVNATGHKRDVWFYKSKTIWRLTGDPATAVAEQTNANVGLAAEKAIVNAGAFDYFYGGEGIYIFNGDREESISAEIDPIFKGDYVTLGNVDIPPIDEVYAYTSVMGLVNGRLRFSYPEPGATSPSVTLEYDRANGRWYHYRAAKGVGGFTALAYEGTGNQVLAAVKVGSNGQMMTLEDGASDDGNAVNVIWQSPYLDQGAPDTEKTYCDVVLEAKTAGAGQTPSTLTVQAVFDNGTVVALGTFNSGTRVKKIFSLNSGDGIKATNFAIRVTGAVTSTIYIYGAWIHYYMENRKGLSFDTGVYALAGGDPADSDAVEIELTSTAAVIWKLVTDLPGGVLNQSSTATIGQVAGRRVAPYQFPAVRTGRYGRQTLNSTAPFQVHALRQRVRAFGEYIDGANSMLWTPLPYRMGDGRVVQIKDLVVQYEGGPGNITLATDMPGGSLASRGTYSLPAASSQKTLAFPVDQEGSLIQWGGNSTAGLKLLSGVIRWRPMGVYFDGARGEYWEITVDLGQPMHFREIELDLDTSGAMTLDVALELPGMDLVSHFSSTVNTETTTTGRRPWNQRTAGNLKGQLLKLRLSGSAVVRMWGAKIYARPLNAAGGWRWIPLPVPETPVDWMTAKLPIRETAIGWTWIDFPVDAAG